MIAPATGYFRSPLGAPALAPAGVAGPRLAVSRGCHEVAGARAGSAAVLASTVLAVAAPRRRRRRRGIRCGRAAQEGGDGTFPWSFTGRVRFRPALVSAPEGPVAEGVQPLSVFGVTVGGSVCLEYDTSPVGPYLEVVQMSAAVFSERLFTTALWGKRLMVNDARADSANGDVWGVPSELRDIAFEAEGPAAVFTDEAGRIRVRGWGGMRFAGEAAEPWGQLPIWWTPTLKALWLPASPWRDSSKGGALPLRRLRLSAASVRLRWAPADVGGDSFVGGGLDAEPGPGEFRAPLPFVVEADGVLIEIGEVFDVL